MKWFYLLLCVAATSSANLRWWRVSQREHYLAGSATRFALRWWLGSWPNRILLLFAFVGVPFAGVPYGTATPIFIITGPLGLDIKGRTSPLAWTRRLRTLAAVTAVCQITLFIGGLFTHQSLIISSLVTLLSPVVVDVAAFVTLPWERRIANQFATRAAARLATIDPTVIAITGSYGKTSTKVAVAHLLTGTATVLASPASYNNRAGLSRTINEQLTPGTDVLVAEMGTYGKGEIAELCELCPPYIAVLTAIGPVHLERFKNEDEIIKAKAEIFERASVAVLNIDDPRLAALADRLTAQGKTSQGKTVWRCSAADSAADVAIIGTSVWVNGERKGELPSQDKAVPGNVACAVAVALERQVPLEIIMERLKSLPVPPHRAEISIAAGAPTIIDDTYNSNPAGALRALEILRAEGQHASRRVVVTPGMVELGSRQAEENERFAERAAKVATDVIIVGRTNRRALEKGAARGGAQVVLVSKLPQAVAWVRQHVGTGDVVLYANDLPDHFA